MIRGKPVKLTSELKERILALCREAMERNEAPDLMAITRVLFDKPNLDGRSYEGKAVKAFLIEKGVDFVTTGSPATNKKVFFELSAEQRVFVEHNCNRMSPFQMAIEMFPNERISPNDDRIKKIEYYASLLPAKIEQAPPADETIVKSSYKRPAAISTAISKINNFCNKNLDSKILSDWHIECANSLIRYLNSDRFVSTIDDFEFAKEQQMFESQFVYHTWDKPDLIAEDVNQYIDLCVTYVQEPYLLSLIRKLDRKLSDLADDTDRGMSKSLSDTIKVKTDELNNLKSRRNTLINNLTTKRSARLKDQKEANKSFLFVVRAFMMEREREKLIKAAEMQRKILSNEIDRIESFSDIFARVMGVSREEILN